MQPFTKSRRRTARLALGIAFLGLSAVATAQPANTPAQSQAAQVQQPQTRDFAPDEKLFTFKGKTFTAGEWEDIIKYNPPSPMFRHVSGLVNLDKIPVDVIEASINEWVLVQVAAEKARAEGRELSPAAQNNISRDAENAAIRTWLDMHGINDVAEPTEEEKRAHYEKNKEQFKKQEELTMRHIFLSTYENYTVKDGDSLESIAENISGDPEKAEQILDANTKQPRIEAIEGAEEAGVRPLQAGEELLVPMNEEKVRAVAERAKQLAERIKGGEDFNTVSMEVAGEEGRQNMMVVRPKADNKPILPEVRKAFESIENGEVSDPIRTKHGYQLIMRVNYQKEEYIPFEQLEDRIAQQLSQEKRQGKLERIITELWEKEKDLRPNEEVMENLFKPEYAEKVLIQVSDVKYTAGNFTRDFADQIDENSTMEERRAALAKLGMVQRFLVVQDVENQKVRETEEFKQQLYYAENQLLAGDYINQAVNESTAEPTEEAILAKFEEMRENIEKQPSADAWQIVAIPETETLPNSPQHQLILAEELETLRAKTEGIESLDQFKEKAAALSEDTTTAPKGGEIGRIKRNYLNGLGARVLQEEGEGLKGPFTHGGKVYLFWIQNRSDTTPVELEEVRDTITQRAKNEMLQANYEKLREQLMNEAELEIHISK